MGKKVAIVLSYYNFHDRFAHTNFALNLFINLQNTVIFRQKMRETKFKNICLSRNYGLKMHITFFGLVWFYGISTIVGYLMPNSFLYIHIKYMISKYILWINQ